MEATDTIQVLDHVKTSLESRATACRARRGANLRIHAARCGRRAGASTHNRPHARTARICWPGQRSDTSAGYSTQPALAAALERLGLGQRNSGRVRRRARLARNSRHRTRLPARGARPFSRRATLARAASAITSCPSRTRAIPSCCTLLRDRPLALYVAGNIDALGEPQVAVVGSRNPTPQGSEIALDFARRSGRREAWPSPAGWRVGIDAAAHRGALDGARSHARPCSAAGIDVIYPREQHEPRRGHPAAGRPGQRVSAGHRPPAQPISTAKSHHRGLEPRHPGGRGGAQQRLADHRARGPRLRPGGIRRAGLHPQPLEPRLPRAHQAGRETDRNCG